MAIPIFIPSYGRADNLRTAHYYADLGYPAEDVYVFIDNEDETREEYEKVTRSIGCHLVVYDIAEARRRYDYVHRAFQLRRSTGQCVNMLFDYAKENGINFFMVQDDDTQYYLLRSHGKRVKTRVDLDDLLTYFEWIDDFMHKHKIGYFGFSQGGDFYGDENTRLLRKKVMNTTFYLLPYVYRVDRGVLDCDTSGYCRAMYEGLFCGSLANGLVLEQCRSAQQKGGLTPTYKETKLLAKSLVAPIQFPSAVYAERQIMNGGRLHHRIRFEYLMPKILKGERNNIGWDTYPEDTPFTNEPKRAYKLHD